MAVVLTPGQRHDSTQLEAVLDAIRVPRPGGRGRPRKRPDRLIGDKGYAYERCRRLLRRRGIPHVIPERDDQRARRAHRPGRKPAFDREAYRRRNVGGALRQPAQAVAGDRHPVREAGGQLPGDGRRRRHS